MSRSFTCLSHGAVEETGPTDDRDGEAGNDRITQATSVAVVAAALLVWVGDDPG
jgi:hypothetical protein